MTAVVTNFELIGGAPAVREAVRRFYDRLVADPELAGFFSGVDLATLKRHQVDLLSMVLGGPSNYTGRDLGEAHAHLAIDSQAYAKVGGHLVAVLAELGVPEHVIASVTETLTSVSPQIVTH
ncbi:hemoglobin [Hamadaea flava]|uniref:Group 1 truncated hemoglobin n=1 Tax=Hamadaea flava TaxID=1742688 RepID=A0ABV8M2Z4_9ACTN|nr:group 1 truncated hemoglobin [Hamadaea flava]MCP2328523.1 hemoglobin [Hamadaea flava]